MRIEIDLNSRDALGRTPAYLADADGYVAVGDTVTAFESEDEVAAPAVVREVAHGVAYLDVCWNELRDDVPAPVVKPVSPQVERTSRATSSSASWFPIKIKKAMTPVMATAAAVAAVTGVGMASQTGTTAPNSVSARTYPEAGDVT
ncbi:hypothetical protein ABT131_30010 [Streptomyces sp900105245]|uniref:hypothetical protein n=1 Tax=Streptomyces sp. 900105245 TaxID=3154379 RepID=UPI0033322126